MKKAISQPITLEKIHQLLETKFNVFEKQIRELEHNQKISDQKTENLREELLFRIMAEAASTRQSLEQTLRAEIQVANDALKSELKNAFKQGLEALENRLSERLTHVAELITIELGNKIQNHEKRIKILEQTRQIG